ncbi:MAG: amino acid racemase [Bacteroidales bacterium]|nr:amino acid racemase [Bacteroidales bacterium]
MKTIGLIGGLTWESTLEYYRVINREINKRLGSGHSAKMALISLDFEEVTRKGADTAGILCDAARKSQHAGADFLLLGANTPHRWAEYIIRAIDIPLLHIADPVGRAINKSAVDKALLLGTKFTMEEDFIRKKLEDEYGIQTIIPENNDRKILHDIIYKELSNSMFSGTVRDKIRRIMMKSIGDAGGVILGCTELPLVIRQEDAYVPLFDTLELHARAAVDFALE